MDPSELISSVLSFNNSVLARDSLTKLCSKLGVKEDSYNSASIVSYAALTQILQHVTGMAVSFGRIDFNGNNNYLTVADLCYSHSIYF